MYFGFNDEQLGIRDAARDFFANECPTPVLRQIIEQPSGYSEGMWRKMAEIGLQGLPFPEEYGGQGLGFVELALVLEEMGRAAVPSPYFATVVLAGSAIMAGGTDDQKARYLPGIANGELKATLAFIEDDINYTPSGVQLKAERNGDGWTLTGRKQFVPFAHAADLIIVPARTGEAEEAITLFVVEQGSAGLSMEALTELDLTNRDYRLTFDGVRVAGDRVLGAVDRGWPALEVALRHAAVGACAEMLGAARRCLEMSVEYAKVREQFNQPIGLFQAIKHMAAEMLVDVENAHAATYYAAWAQGATEEEAKMGAAVAKATVSEGCRTVANKSLQLHGGIGFTWDHDLHFFMKRIYHNGPKYGDPDAWRAQALEQALASAEAMAVA